MCRVGLAHRNVFLHIDLWRRSLPGTKYRGEFEERMKKLMKEVFRLKECHFFIDELHTIIGAGRVREGSMDASKPCLEKPGPLEVVVNCMHPARLQLQKEYRKYFEKDSGAVRDSRDSSS